MIQKVNVPVTVYLKSDSLTHKSMPVRILWARQQYDVKKLSWHHKKWFGRTLCHEYFVLTNSLHMHLRHNTETQEWTLMEIDDGELN
jgi:hypothetical protein